MTRPAPRAGGSRRGAPREAAAALRLAREAAKQAHADAAAAAALCAALERPTESTHAALLRAWQNPSQRLQDLADALRTPLSNDEQIGSLRAAFAPHE